MSALCANGSPWINGTAAQWSGLTDNRKTIKVKKETVLYHQGDTPDQVFLIETGRVRITAYQESGTERQLYIAEKGCLIAENSVIMGQLHTSSAVAIVDSSVYSIPANQFIQAMKLDFSLAWAVMEMICRKQNILFYQVLGLSFSQSLQRISRVLLNLLEQYGKPCAKGTGIGIRFTHQDVANITGASRVTVSNTFNMLSDAGILCKENGVFVVCDIAALEEYAQREKP